MVQYRKTFVFLMYCCNVCCCLDLQGETRKIDLRLSSGKSRKPNNKGRKLRESCVALSMFCGFCESGCDGSDCFQKLFFKKELFEFVELGVGADGLFF